MPWPDIFLLVHQTCYHSDLVFSVFGYTEIEMGKAVGNNVESKKVRMESPGIDAI